MSRWFFKFVVLLIMLLVLGCVSIRASADNGAVILGLNLEFTDGEFSDEAFDGGWGIHMGYEFKSWKRWKFGGLFEYMNGWYAKEDLEVAGEMKYDSKSLYATARPENWPIMFKAGIVDADYSVLRQTGTRDFRDESDIGYGYGVALVLGSEQIRVDLLDVKRIKIGSDTFTSYGITITVLAGLDFD